MIERVRRTYPRTLAYLVVATTIILILQVLEMVWW